MKNIGKFLFLFVMVFFLFSCSKDKKTVIEETMETLSPLATKIIDSDNVERFSFNNNIEEYKSILFGNNDTIEWIVLEKNDDSFILLSKYILGVEQYDKNSKCESWDESTLRDYLNNEFLTNSFSSDDMKKIEPVYKEDYITIMSIEDVEEYFTFLNSKDDDFYGNETIITPNKKIITKGTKEIDIDKFDNELYAKSLVTDENNELKIDKKFDYANGMSDYWLRDIDNNKAKYVEALGYLNQDDLVSKKGIRPMIRVKKQ